MINVYAFFFSYRVLFQATKQIGEAAFLKREFQTSYTYMAGFEADAFLISQMLINSFQITCKNHIPIPPAGCSGSRLSFSVDKYCLPMLLDETLESSPGSEYSLTHESFLLK